MEPSLKLAPSPLDPESQQWLASLRAGGRKRDEAVVRLHTLLLRAARFELNRRREQVVQLRGDVDELASQCASDACLSVLRRLDDFRGESRFTTWAYKFALLEASVAVRRRAWAGREVPLDGERWALIPDSSTSPDGEVERSETLGRVRAAIRDLLTPHQRRVLIALAVDGVPIDVLAERLETTRGALYKALHDARRKLRAHLEETT